jgi:hypothetical protein
VSDLLKELLVRAESDENAAQFAVMVVIKTMSHHYFHDDEPQTVPGHPPVHQCKAEPTVLRHL